MSERTVSDLPEGWKYEGIRGSRDPRQCGARAHEARKLFESGAACTELSVQGPSVGAMLDAAEEADRTMVLAAAYPERRSALVAMPRKELKKVLDDNDHMSRQVTELQRALTLKEEQLRAHRRVPLDAGQRASLLADLESTTRRVRDGYGLPTAAGLQEDLRRELDEKTMTILNELK